MNCRLVDDLYVAEQWAFARETGWTLKRFGAAWRLFYPPDVRAKYGLAEKAGLYVPNNFSLRDVVTMVQAAEDVLFIADRKTGKA